MNINKITASAVNILSNGTKKLSKKLPCMTGAESTCAYGLVNFDSSIAKRRILGLFDINGTLPVKNRKINSFEQITPDNLLMVHLTDYLPKGGTIHTLFDNSKNARNTLHFTLNHAVVNPFGGGGTEGWTDKQYAIFTPFKKALKSGQMVGGKYNDVFLEGSYKLPWDSFIYRKNNCVPEGKILFSDASDILGAQGITLVEGKYDAYEMADVLCEKLGYSNLKALHAEGMGTDIQTVNLINHPEKMIEMSNSFFDNCKDVDIDLDEIERRLAFDENWKKIWNKFITSYGLEDKQHCETSYSTGENLLFFIEALKRKNNLWTENNQDYREKILEVISKAKKQKTQPKFFSFEKISEIIQNSDTPKIACEKINQEFGIDNSSLFADLSKNDIESQFDILYEYLFSGAKEFCEWNY